MITNIIQLKPGAYSVDQAKRIFEIEDFGDFVTRNKHEVVYEVSIDDDYKLSISFSQSTKNIASIAIIDLEKTKKSGDTRYIPIGWNPVAGAFLIEW